MGARNSLEGTGAFTRTLSGPYHMVPCSVIKSGEKEEGGGDVQSDGICPPETPLQALSPAFLDVAEILPADSKQ